MSNSKFDAGELRERPEILHLVKGDEGYFWEALRKTWASAEYSVRRNNFSNHGIGATGVTFLMRRQDLSPEHALRWKGNHCFITSIVPHGRNHIKVETALVKIVACENKYENLKFPAVMTEEYHRHDQLEPQAINTLRHVLVTPKCIVLKPGKLVDVEGADWPILTAYLLDPNKNEYVIERTVDL